MNTPCKGCRALEFISDGIKRGRIMNIKLTEPIYNCCFSHKIILDEKENPCCDGECKDKTTRVKK